MGTELDDTALLAAWAGGDRSAGATLMRRHFDPLHRFFRNKVGRSDDVEDLVQQTMLACLDTRDRFRGDADFRAFVFGIARNTLLKYLRERYKRDVIDADELSLADCGLGISTALRARREQQLLLTALRHISIDAQIVLELRYWEQASAKQIAEALGVSVPTVRGQLREAKLELRAALDRLARDPGELASTVDGLEKWAASLRVQWG